MAISMQIASTLSLEKDADIISFIQRQNEIGIKNSTLIKIALRKYMSEDENIPPVDKEKVEELHQEINQRIENNSNIIQGEQPEEVVLPEYIREKAKDNSMKHAPKKASLVNQFDFSSND